MESYPISMLVQAHVAGPMNDLHVVRFLTTFQIICEVHFPDSSFGVIHGHPGNLVIPRGPHKSQGLEFFVEPHGCGMYTSLSHNDCLPDHYTFHFRTVEDRDKFSSIIVDWKLAKIAKEQAVFDAARKETVKRALFTWNLEHMSWREADQYPTRSLDTLLGDEAQAAVTTIEEHAKFMLTKGVKHLEAAGEHNSSMTFMLSGTPGCGKSTAIAVLAARLDAPIYKVDAGALLTLKAAQTAHVAASMLNPSNAYAPVVVVMVEDADRWAAALHNGETLATLLQALDGVNAKNKTLVIRILTSNDPAVLLRINALESRVPESMRFVFPVPPSGVYEAILDRLLWGPDFGETLKDAKARFLPELMAIADKGPSHRVITTFLKLYMFRPNAVDCMVKNVRQLVDKPEAQKTGKERKAERTAKAAAKVAGAPDQE